MFRKVLLSFCAINHCLSQSISSPALDWIQTDGTGAYRFGYATGDEGRHYHIASATADNTVAGRFGYKDPATGGDLQTIYTAGRRGFRVRGPHIARRMDLSQIKPPFARPTDDGEYHPELDNVFDPNENRGYDFSYRTPDHIKEEHADRVGDVQGRYSYLDDIGLRHDVNYIAGTKTGFVVSNPVPDTFARARGGPLYYVGKTGGSKVRGFSAVQKTLSGAYRFLASGPDHKRSEISDASGNRRGIYTYLDDKGIQHTVEYIAGPRIGYKVIKNKKGVNYNPILPYFPDSSVGPIFPSSPVGGISGSTPLPPLSPLPTIPSPSIPPVDEDLFSPHPLLSGGFPAAGGSGSVTSNAGFPSGGTGSGKFPSSGGTGGRFPSGGANNKEFLSSSGRPLSGNEGFPSSGDDGISAGGFGSGESNVFPFSSSDDSDKGKFPSVPDNGGGYSPPISGSSTPSLPSANPSAASKPPGNKPQGESSGRPTNLFKPTIRPPLIDTSSSIAPFPFERPEDFPLVAPLFPSTSPFPIPARPSKPPKFGGTTQKWNYDFDYFFNDPATANKDWSKPVKPQTPSKGRPSSTPLPPTFDPFSDFPPAPFPESSYLTPDTFGEGLNTAESGNGLKPPFGGQDKINCNNTASSGDRSDQRGPESGLDHKSTTVGSAKHYYKGHKSFNYPSRGTVKFGGVKNGWHKSKNDDGYFAIPPGVAVRAHVQSLDIVPFDKRFVSPEEALKHHEDKKPSNT